MQELRFHVSVLAAALSLLAGCGGPAKPSETPTNTEGSSSSSGEPEDKKWEDAKPRPSSSGTGTASAGGSSGATAPAGRRADEYDKEATDSVLNRAAKQVKEHCGKATDENGKPSGPFGKTKVTVVLGHNGHTKSVTVPAPFEGKPTGRCVNQAFGNLIFPPWAGADVTVDWDIELVQPK